VPKETDFCAAVVAPATNGSLWKEARINRKSSASLGVVAFYDYVIPVDALEMLNPSKADHVFLEAAPCFSSDALLLCTYGNPTIFAHPAQDGGSRKKTVSFRNGFDWLGSENARSKTAHFIIRNCYRSRDC
jgi:hypothetical protein